MQAALFKGKTALVTGGARGIGRSICQMLAEQEARVAINYQNNKTAAQETYSLVENTAEKAMIIQADVSCETDVSRMINAVNEQLGPVDLLVNNAGIANSVSHTELNFMDWKRMFQVNVDGPFLTTWAVKDTMIDRKFGRIVNVSSLAGVIRKPDMGHYATTKAAVISFTRHCSEALAPHGIRVNCVAPGLTNTELAQSANPDQVEQLIGVTALGRIGEPSEIADVVKFLLSEDSSFVTGQTIVACGGRC